MSDKRTCSVCGFAVRREVAPWAARCPDCGTWVSDLQPRINQPPEHSIDDAARIGGLEALRRGNFRELLDRIERYRPLRGATVLDVGCAYGWFLDEVGRRGARAIGIEPDETIAVAARAAGHDVRVGLFPEVLSADERFDVITFNDVLEHIQDVRAALRSCVGALVDDGVLSINIPTSDGLGYRVAARLARMGVRGPFHRFWQTGLPSPHTYYFPRAALRRLVDEVGFSVIAIEPLTAITRSGLWQRVHTFRPVSPTSVLGYAALTLATPVLNRPNWADVVQLLAIRSS